MNILQILPELNYGGVETGTVDLVKYLTARGHKAVVVSAGGELVKAVTSAGGIHYSLNAKNKSLFSVFGAVSELANIIRREDIHIVHARSRVPAWIAYFAAKSTGRVFITTCHGYYTKHLLSYCMGWGKLVIVPSQVIGRHMIDDFKVPFEFIRFIPRGVDLDKFTFIPPEEQSRTEFTIVIVGRLTPLKGHMHFIRAIQKVSRSIPNIKVKIVGSAPSSKLRYKEDLELLVKRLGLADIVEFVGVHRNIPEVLSKASLLVLATTTHEAFGRVILEAYAAGVPVVATKVGGVVDIIEDNIDGILVAPGDPDGMAEGIVRILKDAQLASILAKNGRMKAQTKFSLEQMGEKTLDVYREAYESQRILVIKLSALGDLILSIPALKSIRKKFPAPQNKITCLVGRDIASVLTNCPYVDEIISYDFKGNDRGLFNLLKVAKDLRKRNFDLSLDLQNNRKSHILSFLSGANTRYGYQNAKFSFLLNKKIAEDKFILGPLEHQFRILKMLDIELKDKKIELWPSKDDELYIDRLLSSEWLSNNQPLVGLHLGASTRWQTKCWPREYISRLADELSVKDIRMVITGGKLDSTSYRELVELTKKAKPIIACGKTTVNQLACLIGRCNVFIAGDSAPLHIAVGTRAKVIAIFGPTDPRRHLSASENVTVMYKKLPCQPCYKAQCPTLDCMKQITVEEVRDAVLKIIK